MKWRKENLIGSPGMLILTRVEASLACLSSNHQLELHFSLRYCHGYLVFFVDYSLLSRTNAKLTKFLRGHRDENFLKPHGGPVERY